jgi:hypothetical protein
LATLTSTINHFHRDKAHTSPKKEQDIACLQASFQQSKIHLNKPTRKLNAKDKFPDFVLTVSEEKKLAKTLEQWAKNRTLEWPSEENWDDF